MAGLAGAAVLAALATALPAGLRMTAERTSSQAASLLGDVRHWMMRASPVALAALGVGLLVPETMVWLAAILWIPLALGYLWTIRSMYSELPLDPRFRAMLARIRLVPADEPVAAAPELSV
jgi:hypothetical protein